VPRAAGRYHLYISLACPWANRCLAVRNLKVRPKRASHTSVQMRSSCQLDSSVDTVDCVLSSSLTALVTSGSAGLARRDRAVGHAPHLAAHAPGRPQGRAHRLGVCQAGRPAIHVDHRWGPAPERVWRGRHLALSPPRQLLCGSGANVLTVVQGGCCAALTATGRRLRSAASALWVAAAGACEVGGLYRVRLGLQEWLAWRVHVCALFLQA